MRVIHTGDTHIGYSQYHSPERREDFLSAFEAVVADAVADDVDAVVHAGDLFDDRRPDLRDVLGTIAALRDLRAASIPFLAVVGNHEGTRDAQWLDLFERLDLATRLDAEGTVIDGVAFYGLDYVPPSARDGLDYDFADRDAAHAALVAHGLFSPLAAYGDWDAEAVLEASPVEFNAVLLGDDHHPDRTTVGDTWLTYCGSTERASTDEREQRGYNVVEFDDGVTITRRGLDTRRFVFVDVDLAEGEGAGRVRERLREERLEDAVAVVTVEGDGEEVVPAEIEAFGDEQGALVTRVTDRREREDEATTAAVQFADPDEAVRERVAEMGLSGAGRNIDDAVRDVAGTPDSRVRDEVGRRVRSLLDEDPDALVADADEGDDAEAAVAGPVESDVPADDEREDGDGVVATAESTDATGGADGADGADAGDSEGGDATATTDAEPTLEDFL
jgi:exonuclease SbcD